MAMAAAMHSSEGLYYVLKISQAEASDRALPAFHLEKGVPSILSAVSEADFLNVIPACLSYPYDWGRIWLVSPGAPPQGDDAATDRSMAQELGDGFP